MTRLAILLALVLAGCTAGTPRFRDAGPGGPDARILDGCNPDNDSDGDGIADDAEGTIDSDGDGVPNHQDTDSDGDGILDAEEHQGNIPCSLPDADGDGIPNWLDPDSDNDGLSDLEERGTYSTDPYAIDSDGDGVTDLGEAIGTMTDPNDPTSTIPPQDFFVVLPYFGDAVERTLRFDTNLQLADIYFLIDTTGSMGTAISSVQTSLTRIAAQIGMRIPNVQMGVGQFRDFPIPGSGGPFGIGGEYGDAGDRPYFNEQNITPTVSEVQAALGRLSAGGGADGPESSSEALFQTATGRGGNWTAGGDSHSIPPQRCTAVPDETGRRRGYPCFRPDSLPIVVHVTDAPFHMGPSGSESYSGITPVPASFEQAVNELNNIGARFIGVSVDGGGRAEEEAVARMTGSVDSAGAPLVYTASGGEVSDAIIEGIETLAGRTPQDVDTTTENVPGNPDEVDATMFIKAITPLEGYNAGNSGPMPGVTYASKDDRVFYQVIPGTQVEFTVRFLNDFRMPAVSAQIFRAVIIVRGNGVARLDSRNVYIVVPPDGAIILI